MGGMYLFIAHKPDSADYCRGHLMASYSGCFMVENHLDRDAVIRRWADVMVLNEQLRCGESHYNVYIFRDGVQIVNTDVSPNCLISWDGYQLYDQDEQWEEYSAHEQRDNEDASDILQAAKTMAARQLAELKEQAAAKQRQEAEARAEKERQQRQRQYETLKKEFAPNQPG